MWGSDHKASLTPAEFKEMRNLINRVNVLKGKNEKHIYSKEIENAKKITTRITRALR